MAKILIEDNLDNLTIDHIVSQKLFRDGINKKDKQFFHKAIRSNPQNGIACFNYAVSLELEGESVSAMYAFLMTSCIQPWDSESWKNCLVLAVGKGHFDIFPIIYGEAYESVGSD